MVDYLLYCNITCMLILFLCMKFIVSTLIILLFKDISFSAVQLPLISILYRFGECSALHYGHGSFLTHTPLIFYYYAYLLLYG